MKTHRNGENPDVLDPHHLMFTLPDNHLLQNLAEPKNGLPPFEEPLPGPTYSGTAREETVMVKLEPNGEDFQGLSQVGADNGTGAPDQSQLWTSGIEKSSDAPEQTVCVLLQDVKYHLSPAAGAASEQQGYTSPIKDLPFLDNKENEEMMPNDQYSVIGIQPSSADIILTPDPHDQHITHKVPVSDYDTASDQTPEGGVFGFNMNTSADHGGDCGEDAGGQNCFICSSCGQSFDSFSIFQRHQCEKITEQPFSCEICGKIFHQMSILKLHLKLHVE